MPSSCSPCLCLEYSSAPANSNYLETISNNEKSALWMDAENRSTPSGSIWRQQACIEWKLSSAWSEPSLQLADDDDAVALGQRLGCVRGEVLPQSAAEKAV